MKIIAKTFHGLEETLSTEVQKFGGTDVELLTRAIMFEGDLSTLYACNYLCRTAIKFIIPVKECEITTEQDLYNEVYAYPWETIFKVDQTFAINGTTSSKTFNHSQYIALKAKDAVADRFREKFNRRPNVDVQNPDIGIDIHIRDNTMTISLDSTGSSLHMRGYRAFPVDAPINEILAAGMVLMSGWKGETPLLDPMCGSGTILIEAARIACNIPPQKADRKYLFMNWNDYSPDIFKQMQYKALSDIKELKVSITAYDKDLKAVRATQTNIAEAGLEDTITVDRKDFFQLTEMNNLTIITNPPYDERLKLDDDKAFYKAIGDRLKHHFVNCTAWILSGNIPALKFVGLRPSKKISVNNGPIESRFYKFEVYEGTKF